MSRVQGYLIGLTLLAFVEPLPAQEPTPAIRGKLAAAQKLVEQKPTAGRWLGLAEMRFAAGQRQAGLDALRQAGQSGDWAQVAALKGALEELDRPSLLRLAETVRQEPPGDFPTRVAEMQHLDLLVELGLTRTQ